MASDLEKALSIAFHSHEGQHDKAGDPYILHVMRVVLSMDTPMERVVAALHDVVEDSDWTLKELETIHCFPSYVIEAVDALTRRYPDRDPEGRSEDYQQYILRLAKNPTAVRVKLADLDDHLNYHANSISDEAKIRYCRAYRVLKTFVRR